MKHIPSRCGTLAALIIVALQLCAISCNRFTLVTFSEEWHQLNHVPRSQAQSVMPRPPKHADFAVRPIDAKVHGKRLYIAMELSGREYDNDFSDKEYVYDEVAAFAEIDMPLRFFNGTWVLTESGSPLPLAWSDDAPRWVRSHSRTEPNRYPQFYGHGKVPAVTTFWLWLEPAGAMPTQFQIESAGVPQPPGVYRDVFIVPHSPVQVRTK